MGSKIIKIGFGPGVDSVPPAGGGGGDCAGDLTASPESLSLNFVENATSATIGIVNTATHPGAFRISSLTGPYTSAISGSSLLPDDGGYVPYGSSGSITLSTGAAGQNVGVLSLETTEGSYTINVSSSLGYIPLILGPVAVYDFAKMYVDGDYSNGATITTVEDKSGNGHDGTSTGWTFDEDAFGSTGEAGPANQGANNGIAVPSAVATAMTTATIAEVWTVSMHSSAQAGPIIDFAGNANAEHHPLGGGVFYSGFGSSTRITGANIGNWAAPKIVRWTQSDADDTLIVRNVTDSSDIINQAIAWTGFASARENIGFGSIGQYYDGPIGFVAFFDKVLTTDERNTLQTYLEGAFGA